MYYKTFSFENKKFIIYFKNIKQLKKYLNWNKIGKQKLKKLGKAIHITSNNI